MGQCFSPDMGLVSDMLCSECEYMYDNILLTFPCNPRLWKNCDACCVVEPPLHEPGRAGCLLR